MQASHRVGCESSDLAIPRNKGDRVHTDRSSSRPRRFYTALVSKVVSLCSLLLSS